jgi:hypothetical protein
MAKLFALSVEIRKIWQNLDDLFSLIRLIDY